ncbi:chromate efflux transporter [Afipia felis]|uniref:Chromate transporter, chromate ion transporter (CHR) family n=2 Tax=Afipia felis TaxID=1035 RepID=A0A380W478_AFIFE|nr:chromate efflux transporter [Afipia felis]EKS30116.1 chromate ion transporter (CHR) family chromate transporter [Afipia felis ATCC 53690]SUU74861.1 chromate transporter, chromate ion transporter (CHR) family [Afipia felis]SUU82927.1 chromate transporter, chromate ion transporter (CHR) family [Afipia felis]
MGNRTAGGNPAEVFSAFLKLGLTSFGGPVAHLGYFRGEFVERRKWLSEGSYADLVALCQFLPGPASSQVGIAIGLIRGGYIGALAAWTAFTLPSALALVLFAYGIAAFDSGFSGGWLHGLKVAAVAVVALAILGMARALTPDRIRAALAVAAMTVALVLPSAWGQIAGILLGGCVGWFCIKGTLPTDQSVLPLPVSRATGISMLIVFGGLLVALPLGAAMTENMSLRLFDTFYRVGSLVFGGGHVVLPLLKAEVVPAFVNSDTFLAGYGATQAVPGPLFTFAAYLGAVIGGWTIAAICLAGIFLPSFLLVIGALPFWDALRRKPAAQSVLAGVNAAVVGLLLAAFYDPVWTAGITNSYDYALGLGAFVLLFVWKAPPWLVVILCGLAGQFALPLVN